MTPVSSVSTGTNADLIAEAVRLYAPPDAVIADVTYSTGRFWRKCPGRRVLASDLTPHPGLDHVCDFRALPYAGGSIDIVVLDPPYAHNAGVRHAGRGDRYEATGSRYNGHSTTAGMYNADIMQLYREGMAEAFRVLKPDGGQLWVKCKDEVQREIQCWSHITIFQMALELGFWARDLFVLVPSGKPAGRWPGRVQRHARKEHSFLWVMERPDARYAKLLGRTPPGHAVPGITRPRACACGCGRPVTSPRAGARYAAPGCRVRAHRAR